MADEGQKVVIIVGSRVKCDHCCVRWPGMPEVGGWWRHTGSWAGLWHHHQTSLHWHWQPRHRSYRHHMETSGPKQTDLRPHWRQSKAVPRATFYTLSGLDCGGPRHGSIDIWWTGDTGPVLGTGLGRGAGSRAENSQLQLTSDGEMSAAGPWAGMI